MKKLLIALITILLSCTYGYSQKAKLKELKGYLKGSSPALDKAKEASDVTILDETTKGLAETWYYRGLAYRALYGNLQFDALCNECLQTAYESFMKSEEIDNKSEWVLDIESKQIPEIKGLIFDSGVEAFQKGKFADALVSFEYVLKISPAEVAALNNAAFAADYGNDYEKAANYYKEIIRQNQANDKTYASLAKVLLNQKDTVGAIAVLSDGRKLYPDSIGLIFSQINIYLSRNEGELAIEAIDQALLQDPNNASLYLAEGSVNESLAQESADSKIEATYKSNAKKAYEKGLSKSPENFELNYNMGVMLFNEGTTLDNSANALNDNKAFEQMKKQASEKYKEAQAFLEKAYALQPEDQDVLNSLKQLYFRTKDDVKYNQIKAKLEGK